MTSKSFPARDNNLFDENYTLNCDNRELVRLASELEEHGFINVRTNTVYRCVSQKDEDYLLLEREELDCRGIMYDIGEDLVECEECGRQVDKVLKSSREKQKRVTKVNFDRIETEVGNSLEEACAPILEVVNLRKQRNASAWWIDLASGERMRALIVDKMPQNMVLNYSFVYPGQILIGFSNRYCDQEGQVINGLEVLYDEPEQLRKNISAEIFRLKRNGIR